MLISKISGDLEKDILDEKKTIRRWGPEMARLIRRRINEIQASENLAVLRKIKRPNAHELTGDLKGRISLDLKHPKRMIVKPSNDPIPTLPDGGLDWTLITEIEIVCIGDTHGR
jgi:plasmid maintenance system killer protein